MSVREWLHWFLARQRPKREVGKTRQNPTNENERLSRIDKKVLEMASVRH